MGPWKLAGVLNIHDAVHAVDQRGQLSEDVVDLGSNAVHTNATVVRQQGQHLSGILAHLIDSLCDSSNGLVQKLRSEKRISVDPTTT